jgi:alkylhydroperoxidase family enzyme
LRLLEFHPDTQLTTLPTGWNSLLGAIRTKTSLPPSIREIAICRPALINQAWFEWNAHAPILLKSVGFTEAKLKIVQQLHPTAQGELNDQEWAVLLYADEMTRNVKVDDKTFERLRNVGFNEKGIVEITATVASYNLVSRFLVALDVGEQNAKKPEWVGEGSNL